jgi:undecaprenyl-phosphate galactose phosphotransferase
MHRQRNVIVVGQPSNLSITLHALVADFPSTYRVQEVFICHGTKLAASHLPASCRRVRQSVLDEAQLLLRLERTKALVILAFDQSALLRRFIPFAYYADCSFALVPPLDHVSLHDFRPQYCWSSPTVMLWPRYRRQSWFHRCCKQSLDILGSIGLGILFSPFLIGIFCCLKMTGGPVFYAQRRIGLDGHEFDCWKFRTMCPEADKKLKLLLARKPAARQAWRRDFKLKNDPRITKIGAILRCYSLDELPQLWNVLKGDMSLVGPRPVTPEELNQYYGEACIEYQLVRPGITGLWQISGRNDAGYAYRVSLDSWYVTHWSLWLDILILARTAGVILRRRGAY